MSTNLHQLKVITEHKQKHLGLSASVFMAFILFPICWAVDFFWIKDSWNLDDGKLISLTNTFAAIIMSILLTTFSVVFVVMQLASSQFSPRILRYFVYSDIKIQQFIGFFLGTASMSLLPQLVLVVFPNQQLHFSLLAAIFFCFWCILISFPRIIVYLSDNMNVASITNRIKNDVVSEINALYHKDWKPGIPMLYKRKSVDPNKFHVKVAWQGASGYLDRVDYEVLSKCFKEIKSQNSHLPACAMFQMPIIGEFILNNATDMLLLAFDSPLSASEAERIRNLFSEQLNTIFSVHKYRSYTQDINFSVRKLNDIAIKAISPAVNDPTTCLNCLDHITEIILVLNQKQFPTSAAEQLVNENIFINEFGFDEFIDFCYDQIYHWGKFDPVVVKRIIKSVKQLLPSTKNPYHLRVLIGAILEMEMEEIYHDRNADKRFTKEQIQVIRNERASFLTAAKARLSTLIEMGNLQPFSSQSSNTDRAKMMETEAMQFLSDFHKRD